MKLVFSSGIRGGFHRSCVGVTDADEAELKSEVSSLCEGSRGWKGSCVTEGFIRYSQLQRGIEKTETNQVTSRSILEQNMCKDKHKLFLF